MNAFLSSQKFKTVCHQISCPPVTCANPSLLEGDCCPSCFPRECGGTSLSSLGVRPGRACPGTLHPAVHPRCPVMSKRLQGLELGPRAAVPPSLQAINGEA